MEADGPEFKSCNWPLLAEEARGNRFTSPSLSMLFSVTRTIIAASVDTCEECAVT